MLSKNKGNDAFADIAAGGMDFRGKGLVEPGPPVLEQKNLKAEGMDIHALFNPIARICTEEQLLSELAMQREKMALFTKNIATEMKSYRRRHYLKNFDWREEKKEDRLNFCDVLMGCGEWEKVRIPHYGGPLGLAVTYYRTEFEVTPEQISTGALFICFKGVDYKAHVFINGCFLGSHEGFFAPFEFEFTACAAVGKNTLAVKVENDHIFGGNPSEKSGGKSYTGDKIYAATGPGYDDPERGWHHCPPGMGIYQDVFIEARPRVYIGDLFIRPLENLEDAEAWVEVVNIDLEPVEITLRISLYGRNFEETVFENFEYRPETEIKVGLGDSFSEAILRAQGKLNTAVPLFMEKGRNRLIIPVKIPRARRWEPECPWLYQLNVEMLKGNLVVDTYSRHFGMRTFMMDQESVPKGALFLNGKQVRLRGANTMGHEQQCVMQGNFDQLRDDILLAKICNMNFLRITQRPVQSEVYDFCDMLGLMIQTDLPLFGVMGRSQFYEGIKQAEEMERLIRCHPCCILASYINEPFPNSHNKPQRFLTRHELMEFFKSADIAAKLNNPDRVIKHVDGDYDPPSETLPDNHCYPAWYNGHGIDIGRLNRGYWLPVKPGWYHGCGEFGSEGLDPVSVMKKYYPGSWLPENGEEEKDWSPNSIIGAQTGRFHYFFYETPESLEDWVNESHKHQAFATRLMTEAFRRDSSMITFAIHLFIDAFPSGWMKAIMDVERRPKPAYFAYRDSLEPLMVSIRADRFKYSEGEEIVMEAWVCNDHVEVPEGAVLKLVAEKNGEVVFASINKVEIPSCSSRFQGYARFKAPKADERTEIAVKLALCDEKGEVLNDASMIVEVFPGIKPFPGIKAAVVGSSGGKAVELAREMGLDITALTENSGIQVILADSMEAFREKEPLVAKLVAQGAKLVFLELVPGEYCLMGEKVKVKISGMMPLHFVSRKTGHPMVLGLKPDDFRLWYCPEEGYIKPLLENTFTADGFTPILLSGNTNEQGEWGPAMAAAEKRIGKGLLIICQVALAGRTSTNPTAAIFAKNLLTY